MLKGFGMERVSEFRWLKSLILETKIQRCKCSGFKLLSVLKEILETCLGMSVLDSSLVFTLTNIYRVLLCAKPCARCQSYKTIKQSTIRQERAEYIKKKEKEERKRRKKKKENFFLKRKRGVMTLCR